jgi:hypothetical protein
MEVIELPTFLFLFYSVETSRYQASRPVWQGTACFTPVVSGFSPPRTLWKSWGPARVPNQRFRIFDTGLWIPSYSKDQEGSQGNDMISRSLREDAGWVEKALYIDASVSCVCSLFVVISYVRFPVLRKRAFKLV